MNRQIATCFTAVLLVGIAHPVTSAAEPGGSSGTRPLMAFSPSQSFSAWQAELREELGRIMAIPAKTDTDLHVSAWPVIQKIRNEWSSVPQ